MKLVAGPPRSRLCFRGEGVGGSPSVRSPQGPLKVRGLVQPHQLHCPKDEPEQQAYLQTVDLLDSFNSKVKNDTDEIAHVKVRKKTDKKQHGETQQQYRVWKDNAEKLSRCGRT